MCVYCVCMWAIVRGRTHRLLKYGKLTMTTIKWKKERKNERRRAHPNTENTLMSKNTDQLHMFVLFVFGKNFPLLKHPSQTIALCDENALYWTVIIIHYLRIVYLCIICTVNRIYVWFRGRWIPWEPARLPACKTKYRSEFSLTTLCATSFMHKHESDR